MDTQQFIAYVNKRNGWHLDTSYYSNIQKWRHWWQGYYAPVHTYTERGLTGRQVKREMYRMRMAKKISEDWASLLLNDKTTIALADAASQKWLQGETQTGGIFQSLGFWAQANALAEDAFWSGTGAFVMSLDGMLLQAGAVVLSPDARIEMDYLPADCILPISVRRKAITEAAFVSESTLGGEPCIYLQTHKRKPDGTYQILNEFFKATQDGSRGGYTPIDAPKGILPAVNTGCRYPWFAIFSPALKKNIDGGPGLGISVFSEALDQIEGADRAYNNFLKDIYLGGKKVFYNRTLIDSHPDGNGGTITETPDDVQQQLFMQPSADAQDSLDDARDPIYEYNPSLRVEENTKAVQAALDYLSFKCGLGTHHYRFDGGSIATATQYNGDRQDMVQNANKHQTPIEAALIQIVRAILWAGKNILGAPVDPETEISINWDDSYITDSESRLANEQADALAGILPKYRYVMDRYGLSEDVARKLVQEASEGSSGAEGLGFGGDG